MQHMFDVHVRDIDDSHETGLEGEERRRSNDRRGQADRRKRDRRGTTDFSRLPLLTEDEIAALLNGAR